MISSLYCVWEHTTPWPLPGLCLLWPKSWKSATFCLSVQEGPERWPPLWASSPAPCLVYLQIPPRWLSSALLPGENTARVSLKTWRTEYNPFRRLFLWLSLTWSTRPCLQHGHQFWLWDAHPVAVAAVDDVYDRICVWVIAPPVGPVEQNDDFRWGQTHRWKSR